MQGAGANMAGAYMDAITCWRGCTNRMNLCLSARRVSSE